MKTARTALAVLVLSLPARGFSARSEISLSPPWERPGAQWGATILKVMYMPRASEGSADYVLRNLKATDFLEGAGPRIMGCLAGRLEQKKSFDDFAGLADAEKARLFDQALGEASVSANLRAKGILDRFETEQLDPRRIVADGRNADELLRFESVYLKGRNKQGLESHLSRLQERARAARQAKVDAAIARTLAEEPGLAVDADSLDRIFTDWGRRIDDLDVVIGAAERFRADVIRRPASKKRAQELVGLNRGWQKAKAILEEAKGYPGPVRSEEIQEAFAKLLPLILDYRSVLDEALLPQVRRIYERHADALTEALVALAGKSYARVELRKTLEEMKLHFKTDRRRLEAEDVASWEAGFKAVEDLLASPKELDPRFEAERAWALLEPAVDDYHLVLDAEPGIASSVRQKRLMAAERLAGCLRTLALP